MHLTSFYTAVVYHSGWPVASLSLARYCECSARLTSKPSISQLVFGSLLIKLAKTRLELQKLWPRFHKESNDVKISGHAATSYHSEAWEELKALLKSGNGGPSHSLTLSHSSLISAFFLSLPSSPSASLSQRRHILNPLAIGLPAVHQQKTINCFIGWSFCNVMSSALPIPGILQAYCASESVPLVKYSRRNNCYFQGFWHSLYCLVRICHAFLQFCVSGLGPFIVFKLNLLYKYLTSYFWFCNRPSVISAGMCLAGIKIIGVFIKMSVLPYVEKLPVSVV